MNLRPMQLSDLDEVMNIEQSVYLYPWSKNNFMTSFTNHDDAWVVCAANGEMLGYFVQMAVVEEMHLLNMTVKSTAQRQGLGRFLLSKAIQQAKLMKMRSMLLEVRASNQPALKLYAAFGFTLIGRRKNYYQQREDALVLRCVIADPD
jgi:ribosomal-protein-alanine N-acetyltransferase